MFRNKHLILAFLIAPVLAIIAWFSVDYFVAEKPHSAKPGASYELIAKPNCRRFSRRCDLKIRRQAVRHRASLRSVRRRRRDRFEHRYRSCSDRARRRFAGSLNEHRFGWKTLGWPCCRQRGFGKHAARRRRGQRIDVLCGDPGDVFRRGVTATHRHSFVRVQRWAPGKTLSEAAWKTQH